MQSVIHLCLCSKTWKIWNLCRTIQEYACCYWSDHPKLCLTSVPIVMAITEQCAIEMGELSTKAMCLCFLHSKALFLHSASILLPKRQSNFSSVLSQSPLWLQEERCHLCCYQLQTKLLLEKQNEIFTVPVHNFV